MKFQKILSIGIAENKLEPKYWERLDKLTEQRVMLSQDSPEIKIQISNADCLLINPFVFKVNKELIDVAPSLKFIGVLATGFGVVDHEYAATKDITVCNIPGYATESVAELAIAILLEYTRDIEYAKQLARKGNYSDVPRVPVYEIKAKKLGIIGTGRIGSRVAEISLALGAEVFYWSINKKPELEAKGVIYQEVEKIISECDFVSLHLALNKDTEGFMNETFINKMKSGAILLNLSPNELVDFNALEKRLAKGDLIYIADHTDEMTPEQIKQLSQYKDFIPYPPIGYQTVEATALKQEIFVGNIENFLKGEPTNKVN
ncbi:MAG: hypothetical protein HYT70_03040 [Candidatus Aenigmarchaeota archaeon]|nr:hypothetical protein [Candidatus Aenigmarchaeota archaeon]